MSELKCTLTLRLLKIREAAESEAAMWREVSDSIDYLTRAVADARSVLTLMRQEGDPSGRAEAWLSAYSLEDDAQ